MTETLTRFISLPDKWLFMASLAVASMALLGCETGMAKAPAAATAISMNKEITDFESAAAGEWQAQSNSSIELSREAAHDSKVGLKWTLHSDGENPYGNSISTAIANQDWSGYDLLQIDVFAKAPVNGRIGCQMISNGNETTLPDLNFQMKAGEWKTVSLLLTEAERKAVTQLSFFSHAVSMGKGDHVFYLDNIRLVPTRPEAKPTGKALAQFSALSPQKQKSMRTVLAPPPLGQRRSPYSVPMYYQQWGGGSQDGKIHADWQEALIKDWAELGLTKLHLYLYPAGNGTPNRNYKLDDTARAGLKMFVEKCEKYDMKIGLRIDPSYDYDAKTQVADYWPSHPNNPNGEQKAYLGWLKDTITLLKGRLEYVILGDEINWNQKGDSHDWNAAVTEKYFKEAAAVIHTADPAAKVCMFSAESGHWDQVVQLIKDGYADYGDAVAINHYDYKVLEGYMNELKTLVPQKKMLFLSNGVGYISSDTKLRNPETDPYSKYNDRDQASMIARTMFTWWALGADVAPYYVCMRNVVYRGKTIPQWYGFFGFEDLVIDNNDKATVKRYPAWYAYQTIATVFSDRPAFTEPAFAVTSDSVATSYLKSYVKHGKELDLILWSDGTTQQTTNIHIASTDYSYPVMVDLLNNSKWTDVTATKDADGKGITLWKVPLSLSPTVIRLVNGRTLKD